MTSEGKAVSVGGAVASGVVIQHEFELIYMPEGATGLTGSVEWRRIFNGLDLDAGFGQVGQYSVFALGAV